MAYFCIGSYDIMLSCWNEDPGKRLQFVELRARFDQMLRTNTEYIYFLPVNNGQAYYKVENAPEGMSLQRSPVLLHVASASNQMSYSSLSAENRPKSFLLADKSPSQMSAIGLAPASPTSRASFQGHRSPRSVSPSQERSSRHPSPSAGPNKPSESSQRPTSMLLSNKRKNGNVYVDDPSKLTPGDNEERTRPASMLVSSKENDSYGVCSRGASNHTFSEGECESTNRRPSSMVLDRDRGPRKQSGRDPRYVDDPAQYTVLALSVPNGTSYLSESRDEAVIEMTDVNAATPSSSPENSTTRSDTPDIQITIFQDSP